MAVSNNITAGLNFVALLSSIAIIASGVWLASRQDNECIRLVRWPIILIGLLIFLVSLAGFVGAFWRVQCLLAVYLVAMIILIVLLLSFVVFAFVVTGPSGAYPISGRAYDEYRLQGYSAWLRHYVADNGNWNRVRACLGGSTACSGLPLKYLSFQDFIAAHLTPLQVFPARGTSFSLLPSGKREIDSVAGSSDGLLLFSLIIPPSERQLAAHLFLIH
ncbi:hypothetical protein AMTR_s00101p00124120 [Amborella trichopoda]|uniref:Tetraspanin n=1 Tax=Amborella trichopoda TaxID=13333 RepID=W1NQB0_AMBTC|nr:hypothetical protein AMTR_s00101p00124120 [Amborella trichopoda]